jgi:hypothetical protein
MKKILLPIFFFLIISPAHGADFLEPVDYPEGSSYLCKSNPIKINSGQNLNLMSLTTTCPRAEKLSGPGPNTPNGSGYITSFKPNLVELLKTGELTPRVDDLHLHHVVWLRNGNQPSFAAGEEKTYFSFPRGYGLKTNANANWGINYMIHNLWPSEGRRVEIRWTIDWVPENASLSEDLKDIKVRWMDVAGDNTYPVFDAEKKFDLEGDGYFRFPDDADSIGHEEYGKISRKQTWTITSPVTLLFTAGHLHPGGVYSELRIKRGIGERTIFRSDAKYYGPAGAASWDVSLEATKRSWAVGLSPGDVLTLHVGYNVKKSSWYEAMGIMPLAYVDGQEPNALDPFDPSLDTHGILTHGRLPENIDSRANKNLNLKDPRKLKNRKKYVQKIKTSDYLYSPGGFSATRRFPAALQRPALIKIGTAPIFINNDALSTMTQEEQVWHTITSCKSPCNRSSGISYPLADGRFDSGQMGYGIDDVSGIFSEQGYGHLNETVTTGTSTWQAPKLKRGVYSYFCRIHPFMRGSFKVK